MSKSVSRKKKFTNSSKVDQSEAVVDIHQEKDDPRLQCMKFSHYFTNTEQRSSVTDLQITLNFLMKAGMRGSLQNKNTDRRLH